MDGLLIVRRGHGGGSLGVALVFGAAQCRQKRLVLVALRARSLIVQGLGVQIFQAASLRVEFAYVYGLNDVLVVRVRPPRPWGREGRKAPTA